MNGHLDAEAMAWTDEEVDGSLSIAAKGVLNVVLQKSIPTQFRHLIIYYY